MLQPSLPPSAKCDISNVDPAELLRLSRQHQLAKTAKQKALNQGFQGSSRGRVSASYRFPPNYPSCEEMAAFSATKRSRRPSGTPSITGSVTHSLAEDRQLQPAGGRRLFTSSSVTSSAASPSPARGTAGPLLARTASTSASYSDHGKSRYQRSASGSFDDSGAPFSSPGTICSSPSRGLLATAGTYPPGGPFSDPTHPKKCTTAGSMHTPSLSDFPHLARATSIPQGFISTLTGRLLRRRDVGAASKLSWASQTHRRENKEIAEAEHYRQRTASFTSEAADHHTNAWNPHEIPKWKRIIGLAAGIAGGELQVPVSWHLPWVLHFPIRVVVWLCFVSLSVTAATILVPAFAWDFISYAHFYAHSIGEAYKRFRDLLSGLEAPSRQSSPPNSPNKSPDDQSRWANEPWAGTYPLADYLFILWASGLALFHFVFKRAPLKGLKKDNGQLVIDPLPPSSLPWLDLWRSLSHHIRGFRLFLGDHSPDFPVSCNDEIFTYDKRGHRFQLSMLVVVDSISFEEVRDGFRRRWINWEPKTRAVISKRWGRRCFKMLHGDEFNLDDHIINRSVDVGKLTIAQLVSQISTAEMPSGKPQWQVWVLQAHNSVDPEDPVARYSYIFGKWNHGYADGSGMMSAIVTRLGDRAVSIANLPEKYRRAVPGYQVFLFYGYNAIRAALIGLRLWCYCAWGMHPYPALLQPHRDAVVCPLPATGIKHYSAPGVFTLEEIESVRSGICRYVEAALNVSELRQKWPEGPAMRHEPMWGVSRASQIAATSNPTKHILPTPPPNPEIAKWAAANLHLTTTDDLLKYWISGSTPRPRPTVNDVFVYCITNAFAQLQDAEQLENVVRKKLMLPPKLRLTAQPSSDKRGTATSRPHHLPLIIPMMCRTSVPTCMDNFTSLVATQLALSGVDNWITEDEILAEASAEQVGHQQGASTTAGAAAVSLTEQARAVAARQIFANKRAIDRVKRQRLREAAFLLICSWCKTLPERLTQWLFHEMYSTMRVCSTNVAAPPIDATFRGRMVHGLFFWPAVPPMLTIGTSVVSLGSRFQLLSVLDECELITATDLARKIYKEEGLEFSQATYDLVIDTMSDILVTLVVEEFNRLKLLFAEEVADASYASPEYSSGPAAFNRGPPTSDEE